MFERLRAGIDAPAIFGASNASREQAKIWGLLEEYNRNNPNAQVDLKHLSHSLGVSSTKNAMNWASYKGMKFDNTTFKANTVGTSYPIPVAKRDLTHIQAVDSTMKSAKSVGSSKNNRVNAMAAAHQNIVR